MAIGLLVSATTQSARPAPAYEILITGPIGPATANYIANALDKAGKANAPLVIIRLDTPGGLLKSTHRIIKTILATRTPVVGYVAPSGARAASAGTYILYATDIAAMAPATNVGAATPVTLGPGGQPTGDKDADKHKQGAADNNEQAPADSQTAERRKIINDSVAYIRSLAERNGRNADWAEQAVRDAASISAETAKAKNVVDLIAASRTELLEKIDGTRIDLQGHSVTLQSAGLEVKTVEPGWLTDLLGFITQPTVALLLFVVGILGLVAELVAPGFALPGVIGALSLIAGLYGFHLLPVNYAALGLIALGVGLMIAEAFAPSFGALGLGGIAAFAFGSLILMETSAAAFQIPIAVIVIIAVAVAGLVTLTSVLFRRAWRTPVQGGSEGLVGAECTALESFEREGRVRVQGESWRARTTAPIEKDAPARVTNVSGLTVDIEPVPQSNSIESGS